MSPGPEIYLRDVDFCVGHSVAILQTSRPIKLIIFPESPNVSAHIRESFVDPSLNEKSMQKLSIGFQRNVTNYSILIK